MGSCRAGPPTFLLNPARRIAHFGKKPPKVPAEVTSPLIYRENLIDLTIYGYIITLWLMGETYEFYVSNPTTWRELYVSALFETDTSKSSKSVSLRRSEH